jgi:glycolate oxidase FAD binding subunit
MVVTARPIGEALGTIVGRDGIRDDADARLAASVDGQEPRWVVRPASIDQLSRVVALAHDEKLAVVPRGGGSSLELGLPPARVDLVLDLAGLDQVVEYNPDDLTVTVQAGISAGALAALLAPRRQFLALDPPGSTGRTLGGITATNASGPLRARYGTMRDLLLGVRFVQADGVVTWGGSKVVKSVSGYDVPKLMVGALGTLGVLGELTLRLHPLPEAEAAWLVRISSAGAAQAFVERLLDSTLQPNRIEFFNEPALAAAGAERAAAAVVVSIGTVPDAVREQAGHLEKIAKAGGARIEPLADGFWTRAEAALTRGGNEPLLHVASLAGRLADTERAITEATGAAAAGASAWIVGCAAVGTFRVRVGGVGVAEAAALTTRLRARVAEFDGSVVIARGPAALRKAVDPWGSVEPGALALLRALRDEFDPRRVLNPGRFVGGL